MVRKKRQGQIHGNGIWKRSKNIYIIEVFKSKTKGT